MSLFQFLTSLHPLSGHLKAALQREGDLHGCVPVTVIALLDGKFSSLSKLIDPKVELNPYKVIYYVVKAAARLSGIVDASEEQLWIRRKNPYPPEITDSAERQSDSPGCPPEISDSANQQSASPGSFSIEAVYIPCSNEKSIRVVHLNVSSMEYYLDVIANQLGFVDASKVLITR